jgi:tetratricopeptide (TPR) repeat protein
MAEGLLGGILGEEGEKPEAEAPDALAGAEAFASAVAARLSGNDPGVARKTEEFLSDQSHLLKIQARHLEDEHTLRLTQLRNQLSEEGTRRLGLRLRVGFQLFLVLVATVIGIGCAIVLYDAVKSHRVVVDSFEISPNLATQALSGRIVAAGLHDRLTQLQATTRTSLEKREISSAWANDIAIDVPETGISIGQIDQMLRTHFGHDQHISGSLISTGPTGLALTVRGSGVLPKTFADDSGDLKELLTRAAEYVYGEAQPGLFIHYLANDAGRYDDAIAFAKAHLATVSVDDKALLLNYWGNSIAGLAGPNAPAEAMALHQEAVRVKPDYWTGSGNFAGDLAGLGDEEGGIKVYQQMIEIAGGRPGMAPEYEYSGYDGLVYNLSAERSEILSDLASTGGSSQVGFVGDMLSIAQIDVQMHEVGTARMRLEAATWDPKSHPDVAGFHFTQALLAEEIGDLAAAAKSWDDYAAEYAVPLVHSAFPSSMCWAAPTYERTAQRAKADAALAAPMKAVGISTYLDCYRFNGDVLDLRGDWAGAQQWYQKAVKLAPSFPAGYYSWGLALLKHGDLQGATEQLRLANRKGPNWADPLKAWGDVLMKQNNAKEALIKYDEALRYAPNWKQLKDAREAAAKLKT